MCKTKPKKIKFTEKASIHGTEAKSTPLHDFYCRMEHRAHELHIGRGFWHGHALDNWLEADREIVSRKLPA